MKFCWILANLVKFWHIWWNFDGSRVVVVVIVVLERFSENIADGPMDPPTDKRTYTSCFVAAKNVIMMLKNMMQVFFNYFFGKFSIKLVNLMVIKKWWSSKSGHCCRFTRMRKFPKVIKCQWEKVQLREAASQWKLATLKTNESIWSDCSICKILQLSKWLSWKCGICQTPPLPWQLAKLNQVA